jgi:rod shape determining protein RodA
MAMTRNGVGTRRSREVRLGLDAAPVRHFDFVLVGAAIVLSLIGLVMIWSTTRHRIPGDELYFVKRQALFLVLGVGAMFAVISIDYRRLRDHSMLAYGVTVALLLAVLAPLGSNIKGHQAWFQLPGGFTLQPSELAKFGMIVALAGYCNQYRGELDAWRITTILALAAVPIGLVFLQPDLGTVLVLVVIMLGLLAAAGLTGRQLLVLVLLAITGIYAVVNLGVLKDYQIDRFTSFVDPGNANSQGNAYNQEQSKQAIAHGRFGGEGLGQGSQTQGGFVPEQHTDFIFTSVGEELGFLGAVVLLDGLVAEIYLGHDPASCRAERASCSPAWRTAASRVSRLAESERVIRS